jgi:plastocyanin
MCVLAVAACGSKSPTAPDSGAPGPSGATITIANGTITPKSVTITSGQSVTFVNNDGRAHDIDSDPHPNHTDCPAINAVGGINNGQTKLTNALTTARTCGFHDHIEPTNNSFKGTIIIQ